jgi:DNA-binding NarL/FixJ family response regulator
VVTGDAHGTLLTAQIVTVIVVDASAPEPVKCTFLLPPSEVARRAAELAPATSVVLYTGAGDHELLRKALDAVARGFLLKDASLDEVARVLLQVAGGEVYVAPGLADALVTPEIMAELPALTPREREVLALLAEGMTNDGAAAVLSLSPETIQTHVRKAMAKLHADTRTAAVATALRLALIA